MKNIHFIGVSGIGVSAVAKIALQSGLKVSGSDLEENNQTRELVKLGMKYFLGHRSEQVENPDIVVRSAAVPSSNPEVLEAQRKSIPVYLYPEYLAMLMAKKRGIAVAGTHGKTTTTALIGTVLKSAGLDPTIVCGGVMSEFSSNAVAGKGDYFIAEACEYNRSFLFLKKWYSVIVNIEPDHLDTYGNISEIKKAFAKFLQTTDKRGFALINGDDQAIMDVIKGCEWFEVFTVGEQKKNIYRIGELSCKGGFYSFTLEGPDGEKMYLKLPIAGKFNCINVSLAAVLSLKLGIEKEIVEDAINDFQGIERRLEKVGEKGKNPVYSDYAHHPTEIRATLRTLREMYPSRNIFTIFQPHQYSRTLFLFNDFVDELKEIDFLILTDIYRQRDDERFVKEVSGSRLYEELRKIMHERVVYIKDKDYVCKYLEQNEPQNAIIVFLGAGDIDSVARKYVCA